MAVSSVATRPLFTRWHRDIDGPGLRLVVEADGRIAESVELDISELPNRPDLLARIGTVATARLLAEVLP